MNELSRTTPLDRIRADCYHFDAVPTRDIARLVGQFDILVNALQEIARDGCQDTYGEDGETCVSRRIKQMACNPCRARIALEEAEVYTDRVS